MFQMTQFVPNQTGYWEPCKAGSLQAAKAEAATRFKDGWEEGEIAIANGDGINEERVIVATRPARSGGVFCWWAIFCQPIG